jgi:hypothetical protein
MRILKQRQASGATLTRKRIALCVATLSVLATTVTFGAVASGRVATQTISNAPKAPAVYGGGLLMTADPLGGYWTVSWAGVVTPHGGAPTFGSPALSGIHLADPIVSMASSPDGKGYWLVGSDGGVFAYGDAQFYGSTGAIHLNQPVVGIAATPDGQGYWLVASDGGVFTYGDAQFYGSTGAMHLNQPIIGIAATTDGEGYWLVASDGGVFTFGDATFYGSTGAIHLNKPIVGLTPSPSGQGYWLVASDGGVFTYGDAPFYGSLGGGTQSVLGIVVSPPTAGYTLVTSDGGGSVFPLALATTKVPLIPSGTYTTQPFVTSVTPSAAQLASNCQPATPAAATADDGLSNVFAGQTGPGWIAGDATYSTELPDGSDAFVFSDTLVGTAQPNGAASLSAFIHNSELVGSSSGVRSDIGGTSADPQTLIPDTGNNQWQVGGTDVENGSQLVFVNEFAPGTPFDSFTGHSAIAVMSTTAGGMPTFSSIVPVPTDPDTQWGNAVMQSGAYTYIYGSDINTSLNKFYGMKVARVPLGQSLNTGSWQYWNGSGWVSGEANATPFVTITVLTGVAPQPDGVGYVAVSIPGWAGGDTNVELSYSCSPSGPWTGPTPVYAIPQVSQGQSEMAYIPTFHPELSSPGSLVVSYNINSTSGLTALEQNVHLYQPQFLQIGMGS